MIKVIQINVFGKSGSTGRTTWEMHEYFLNNGIESYIAVAQHEECPEGYAISSKFGIYVDALLSTLFGVDGYFSFFPTKKLIQYIQRLKPDVVHLRNLHQSYINFGMLLRYLAKSNIATVITLHDSWFYTGKCSSPDLFQCNKWIDGCEQCPALKYDKRRRIFDRTKKVWRDKKQLLLSVPRLAIVGNSLWTTQNARNSFLSSVKNIHCIYNWIDLDVFSYKNLKKFREDLGYSDKKIILAVSSIWSINGGKGLANYIDLANEIPKNWQIVLIGKLTTNCELPIGITIIPPIKDVNELAKWYSLADVYLNYSESETFGKSVAEALSCGTPIVALNRTANSEMIPNGGGLVIKSAHPKETMVALMKIFSKPKREYINVCRKFAESRFDKQTNINSYIDIYHKLLKTEDLQ